MGTTSDGSAAPRTRPPGIPTMVAGIGASAGGVEALSALVAALPRTFEGALLVVLHTSSKGVDSLAKVLAHAGTVSVEVATDGAALRAGTLYVAPHDRHLLVAGRFLRLADGPLVNGFRPAIDETFASLPSFKGPAVGVLLSGTLDDGTRGLKTLKESGGIALVQDPDEAQHASMIRSAQRAVVIDATLPVRSLAARLAHCAARKAG